MDHLKNEQVNHGWGWYRWGPRNGLVWDTSYSVACFRGLLLRLSEDSLGRGIWFKANLRCADPNVDQLAKGLPALPPWSWGLCAPAYLLWRNNRRQLSNGMCYQIFGEGVGSVNVFFIIILEHRSKLSLPLMS